MTTRSARFLLSVCLILCTSPGFAQCDVYDAYVQAGAGSSEYYSSAVARCYWQGISRVCGHGLVNVRMYSDSPSASESNRPCPWGDPEDCSPIVINMAACCGRTRTMTACLSRKNFAVSR